MTQCVQRILMAEDDPIIRMSLQQVLQSSYQVEVATNSTEVLTLLRQQPFDVVLLDLCLEDGSDGLDNLRTIRQLVPNTDVVIVSAIDMVKTVVTALRLGAADYLTKPFETEDLLFAVRKVFENRALKQENQKLKQQLKDQHGERELIGVSRPIEEIRGLIRRLRGQHSNILISGESGTGKEVVARMIHAQEEDPGRPFIAVNCAAVPDNLMESIFFGHEKGAFTGAIERRIGKFELADGGDIFLDEISTLSPALQAKILRVLQEKELERIGGHQLIKVDFRVIAATNENLEQLVAEKKFREDLWYRLNVVQIRVPPLRERKEDILCLADFFLRHFARDQKPKQLSPKARQLLLDYPWKGNVRELQNILENVTILCQRESIEATDMPLPMAAVSGGGSFVSGPVLASGPTRLNPAQPLSLRQAVNEFEREVISRALEVNHWQKADTSRYLGITRNLLYRRMAELKITK